MMTADAFEQKIRKRKKVGESIGRTKLIAEALRAYEQAVRDGMGDAEKAAYVYQVIKLCNWWLQGKGQAQKNSDNQTARRVHVNQLLYEANQELVSYPIVCNALQPTTLRRPRLSRTGRGPRRRSRACMPTRAPLMIRQRPRASSTTRT